METKIRKKQAARLLRSHTGMPARTISKTTKNQQLIDELKELGHTISLKGFKTKRK